MSAAGLGLVAAAEDRPLQAVGECVFVMAVEVEESTYFGEGERDQASADGCRRVGFGWLSAASPFLALCAVTARKVWASMANVMWRCQAVQVRTW